VEECEGESFVSPLFVSASAPNEDTQEEARQVDSIAVLDSLFAELGAGSPTNSNVLAGESPQESELTVLDLELESILDDLEGDLLVTAN